MKELIILSGIPGAGKSFLARRIWEKHPKTTVIINDDSLRQMITGHNEAEVNETFLLLESEEIAMAVTFAKEMLISTFLGKIGISRIIVDATHFSRQSINFFEQLESDGISIMHVLLDIDPETALANARLRARRANVDQINFVADCLKQLSKDYDVVLRSYIEVRRFWESLK